MTTSKLRSLLHLGHHPLACYEEPHTTCRRESAVSAGRGSREAVDPDADGSAVHCGVVQLGARRLSICTSGEADRAKAPVPQWTKGCQEMWKCVGKRLGTGVV